MQKATRNEIDKELSLNSFILHKSMNWFLYDNGLRHERVNAHVEDR